MYDWKKKKTTIQILEIPCMTEQKQHNHFNIIFEVPWYFLDFISKLSDVYNIDLFQKFEFHSMFVSIIYPIWKSFQAMV